MSRTVRQVALASCLGAIAVSMAPHAAFASAFGLREESAEGLGNAFAGQTAKAYNSSTAYYNPAGMAFLDDSEIASTATWIQPDVHFSGQNSNPLYSSGIGGPNVNGTNGGQDVKGAAIGSLFGVWRIDPKWSAGFSFAVPFGQRSEYNENWVGRYQALASDLTDYETKFSVAYKITDDLSVGGGLRVDYFTGRLTQAVNDSAIGLQVAQGLAGGAQQAGAGATQLAAGAQAAAAAAAQAAAAGNTAQAAALNAQAASLSQQAAAAQAQALAYATQANGLQTMSLGWAASGTDGQARVTGTDYGVGYDLGVLYRISSDTRVGVDYKSKMFHNLAGNSQIQGANALAPYVPSLNSQSVNLKLTLPDSATVGIYHDINDKWAIMSDVQWTEWSTIKTLNVTGDSGTSLISTTPENWKNTWFAALGANYKATDELTLHMGTAYDQTPVTAATRTARLPDSTRYWLSVGASYKVTPKSDVHFGYAHLFTAGGDITDSSALSSGGGVLTGSYKDSVDIFSASYAMRF